MLHRAILALRPRLLPLVALSLFASIASIAYFSGAYSHDSSEPQSSFGTQSRVGTRPWWKLKDDPNASGGSEDADDTTFHLNVDPPKPSSVDNIDEVFNTTLGFERIFMISLPERGDRQDAFTVLAEVSNFTWTLMDGARGENVVNKSLPMGMTHESIGVNGVGSWRAHMNTIRHLVRNKIETALIFEDDADWDVTLRYQLKQYAQATRWLLKQEKKGVPFSPYGDGWDILTIGHCDSEPWKSDMRRWVIPNDPTVILPHLRTGSWIPDMKPWEAWNSSHPQASNHTRICFTADWVACTTAYALSLRGATKLLYWMSMMPFSDKFDNGVGWVLRQRHDRSEMLGISCFPTYIGISHGAGMGAKFSDIDVVGGDHERASSERLQFATRPNIDRILRGNDTFVGSYTVDEIEQAEDKSERTPFLAKFEDLIGAKGRPEIVIKSERDDGVESWESIPEVEYNERFGPTQETELSLIEPRAPTL